MEITAKDVYNCRVFSGEVTLNDDTKYDSKSVKIFEDQIMLEPLEYTKNNFGVEKIVDDVMVIFNYWTKLPLKEFKEIMNAGYYSLASYVLIKDFENDRKIRMGKQTANSKFGVALCVNSFFYGNILYWKDKFPNSELEDIFLESGIELSRGGQLQSMFKNSVICPTEEIYELSFRKVVSATLLMVVKLLQRATLDNKIINFNEIVLKTQLFLNIVEECRRITIEDPDNEVFGEDISEGNFTLPIIYAINNYRREGTVILNIMRKRTKNVDFLKYTVNLIKRLGSLEYCKQKLEKLKEEILDACKELEPNPILDDYIKANIVVPEDFKDVAPRFTFTM